MATSRYDRLYRKGGFRYERKQWPGYVRRVLQDRCNIVSGDRVLDAPCGDGFWSELLRDHGATVVATDMNATACDVSGGIQWNLEDLRQEWIGAFDVVFCRGLTHLHHEKIPAVFDNVVRNMIRYAPNVLFIYWTSQTNRHSKSGRHFNHTRKALDAYFDDDRLHVQRVTSFMWHRYYHAIVADRED